MSVEGYLQKRGAFKRWSPVYLRLQGDQVSVIDLKDAGKPNAQAKDVLVVEHVERLDKEELGFTLHFAGGASRKGLLSGAKEKWLLRAESRDTYNKWWSPLQASLQSKRGGSQPAASPGGGGGGAAPAPEVGAPGQQDFSYGLPPTDPRTDLPIALVPEEHGKVFAFLKMAVIHWFGVVKQLGSDFDTSENIAVLGDKCVYICSPTADVQRCIRVADITKVLVAQDSKKELYAILVMPTSIQIEGKPDALEFDMMFHSGDIKRFVRYLRTVYIHQTQKMLPLEQLRDKTQLESEIRLQKPDLWILKYAHIPTQIFHNSSLLFRGPVDFKPPHPTAIGNQCSKNTLRVSLRCGRAATATRRTTSSSRGLRRCLTPRTASRALRYRSRRQLHR